MSMTTSPQSTRRSAHPHRSHAPTLTRLNHLGPLIALLTLLGIPSSALAQSSISQPQISRSSAQSQAESPAELRRQLRDAERELARLQRKLERSDSDRWAVLTPVAPSGAASVALEQFRGFRRGRLGITVETNPDDSDSRGVVVDIVNAGGAADKAGVEAGDVITHWNGTALSLDDNRSRDDSRPRFPGQRKTAPQAAALMELARELEIGDQVELRLLRGNETLEVTFEAQRPEPLIIPSSRGRVPRVPSVLSTDSSFPRLAWALGPRALWGDAELVQLEPTLGEYFGTESGLLVLKTPSDDAFGLKAGDVIMGIGDRQPRDATHALRILQSYDEGENVNLHVLRKSERLVLTATVPGRQNAFFDVLGGNAAM